ESHIDVPIWRYDSEALRDGLYVASNTTEVMCIQLPSLSRGVPLRTWKLRFEFSVNQVEIDPSNNLLVVLSRAPGSLTDPHHVALHLRRFPTIHLIPALQPLSFFRLLPSHGTPSTLFESWVLC
ncbi:hypothetical protein BS47DRAFT_1348143, partial [Hydnum rufescens UP504]